MEEYYENVRESPPEYEPILLTNISRKRFNIQPREDEGKEELPAYSSAISLENVFLKKNELECAVHKSEDRNWRRVSVRLQGTALSLHRYNGSRVMDRFAGGERGNVDLPVKGKTGAMIHSYNLQHADVGIAADYHKYVPLLRFIWMWRRAEAY
jgi:hypothetical protein